MSLPERYTSFAQIILLFSQLGGAAAPPAPPPRTLMGIHTHKGDKTNETKREIAADNVLSLSKNIANVSLVIEISVT